jgi:hypothetical protein
MTRIPQRFAQNLVAACAIAMLVSGCSLFSSNKGQISGKVFLDGKVVTSGTVKFVRADGHEFVAGIAPDGTYRADDVDVGPVKICVLSRPRVPGGFGHSSQQIPKEAAGPASSDPPAEKTIEIPARYKDAATSQLDYTVVSGRQTRDIKLER